MEGIEISTVDEASTSIGAPPSGVRAARPPVDEAQARRLAARLGIEVASCHPAEGGTTGGAWVVSDGRRDYVLSVGRGRGIDRRRMMAAVAVSAELAVEGFPTPAPVPAADGSIAALDGDVVATVRPFVRGVIQLPLSQENLRAAGSLLARIHRHPVRCDVPARTRRLPATWRTEVDPAATPDLHALLEEVASTPIPEDLPEALSHGDLFPDNLLLTASGPQVIDWENVAIDVAVLDLAIAVTGLCRIGEDLPGDRLGALLDGYGALRPLNRGEHEALPAMVRHGAAVLALHRWRRARARQIPPAGSTHGELVRFARFVHQLPTER